MFHVDQKYQSTQDIVNIELFMGLSVIISLKKKDKFHMSILSK